MDRRLELHQLLLDVSGISNVYFQPPSDMQMKYPCIVYKRDADRSIFADNSPYRRTKRYQVTVIDQDPDSAIPGKIAALPLCSFNRHFAVKNLNHDVYSLYF